MKETLPKISVIGLGKLGSPFVACAAHQNYEVIGYDKNPDFNVCLDKGITPVEETGLQEMLDQVKLKVQTASSIEEAVMKSEMTFIIVPTPSDQQGKFSCRFVAEVVREISEALKKKTDYHLVVLTSTVMPGDTQRFIKEALENLTGKVCGKDFGVCYNPEFIALGSVIQDMLKPDFILIGESDKRAGHTLEKFYENFCTNQPPIKRMSLANAEITKISVNSYITTKISFANMLSNICEKFPDGDVDVVTDAIGSDSRIGKKYLKGSVGYGGPCFPRDNVAFQYMTEHLGLEADIPKATDQLNQYQLIKLFELCVRNIQFSDSIGVFGVSYKMNTPVIEKATGYELARLLITSGYKVNIYDPIAGMKAKNKIPEIAIYDDPVECMMHSKLSILTLPSPDYQMLIRPFLEQEGKVMIDCWRILKEALSGQKNYYMIGDGSSFHQHLKQTQKEEDLDNELSNL